ncbi:hypothetical protein [Haloactinomyces albus]|uniref:Uncharacterized protein n=1 Tax=Haloactinomyces albus TaxID=1352928 RepID=A0AAE3ZBK4_9ACTN|nr:hypothetical protein [Haloactinomyces albus]MDR7300514.1 hypothetical protein [Haloactinomyces albus]
MRPGGAARVIALVLCLGMVVGFSSTYLLSAGVPVWIVLFLALLVVGIPVLVAVRSGSGTGRGRR